MKTQNEWSFFIDEKNLFSLGSLREIARNEKDELKKKEQIIFIERIERRIMASGNERLGFFKKLPKIFKK